MKKIDLNCDMGESADVSHLAVEARIMPFITSANIACGFHAGNPDLIRHTARLAARCGVSIGAHPGFLDMKDLGRNERAVTPGEVETMVSYQIGALAGVLSLDGFKLRHVKPHGALYNMAMKDHELATAIVESVCSIDRKLLVFGMAGSELVRVARAAGLIVAQEAFADRAYLPNGNLLPRSEKGAVLGTEEEVRQQVGNLARGFVKTIDGSHLQIEADTICLHSDTPRAEELVTLIRRELEACGVRITAS